MGCFQILTETSAGILTVDGVYSKIQIATETSAGILTVTRCQYMMCPWICLQRKRAS